MFTRKDVELKNRLEYYRNLVAKAIKEKKLFRIYGYTHFPKLRAELIKRGFLEYIVIHKETAYTRMSILNLVEAAEMGNEFEKVLISKLVGIRTPDFIYVSSQHYYSLYPSVAQINRIKFTGINFTQKDDMCYTVAMINRRLQESEGAKSQLPMPRSFPVMEEYAMQEFEDEYNWTMATSLIMFLNKQKKISSYFQTRHYSLEKEGLELVLNLIRNRVAVVDGTNVQTPVMKLRESQWSVIRQTYEGIVRLGQRINGKNNAADYFVPRIRDAAVQIQRYFPWHQLDGYYNVWLVKPARSCCGEGIFITNDMQKIKRHLQENDDRDYVVQKYLEKPFLMHNTKFHLRSYFLLRMDQSQINFYAHPIVQVKIASEPFSLENFNAATHITNISIQRNYKNGASEKLPDNHMMTLERLEEYFEKIGHTNLYYDKIFPSMKQTLKLISEVSLADLYHKAGRYELFGCDWIIAEDLSTQLIEINRSPSMEHYTPVSTIVLSTIIGDLVKVVVDNYKDPAAETGGFDLIYQANITKYDASDDDADSGYSSRKSSVQSMPAGNNYFDL